MYKSKKPKLKNLCIVQARMGSSRLPGKIKLKLDKKRTIIQLLIQRLSKSKNIDKIVVATSTNKEDKFLKKHLKNYNCEVFFGPSKNVLKRYYLVSKIFKTENIIRITADCPFIDPSIIDKVIEYHYLKKSDYTSNTLLRTYPNGQDVEIFKASTLSKAYKNAKTFYEKEHVTPFIKNNLKFRKINFKNRTNLSSLRMTLDYKTDFVIIKKLYDILKKKKFFYLKDIVKLMKQKKITFHSKNITKSKILKEPYGMKLWKRAKKIIPGGNMLLSKRPEIFLPDRWPTYYKRAKGCQIWDVSGKKFIDMSLMGVGTNILGYSNKRIDDVVVKNLRNGNLSSLNNYEEVKLSEILLKINPWADMVKLARTGGEANAISIRIARAHSNSDKIAFCGYHGWHDWYLSANLNDKKNLDFHLLKDLPLKGIPKNLKNTIFPFMYNDINGLEKIIRTQKIGIIKMEVQRDIEPKNNFLKKVRQLANKNKIILIFDECTSGFRQCFGGLHSYYGVNPDIATYGKALGNGYAITAIVGKKKIMNQAQNTFISSTFWTERIGPSAAIETLKIMKEKKSWDIITKKGKEIKERWKEISDKYELDMKIFGLDAVAKFLFVEKKGQEYKTYITQEFLKKNFLASNCIFLSTEHSDSLIEKYINEFDKIAEKIALIKYHKKDIKNFLDVKKAHETLKRLN